MTTQTISPEQTFDRRYYEAMRRQFLATDIGHTALELTGLERRRYEEITSGMAEALPGVVRTDYTFEPKDGKLLASDGQGIEMLILSGYQNDLRITQTNPSFYEKFLPQRSGHEREEFYEQEAMANGETNYDTIITFSPYSEEFDVEPQTGEEKENPDHPRNKLIKAAQKPYWKRAMMRVSHWDGQQLQVSTRSVDNSSVVLLQEVASQSLGYEFRAQNSTTMLGERIRINLEHNSSSELADFLVNIADKILEEKLGGKRVQGRSEKEAQDLQKFVESETEVINGLITAGKKLAAKHSIYESYKEEFEEITLYNAIALLKERLEHGITERVVDYESASFGAGAIARAAGEVYDMCGAVIGTQNSTSQVAVQTGFESLQRLAHTKVECPECKVKVIVPKSDLDVGKLTCNECGYWVDVCTGKKGFTKPRTHKVQNKVPSAREIIVADLARIDRELEQKAQQKQKLAAKKAA